MANAPGTPRPDNPDPAQSSTSATSPEGTVPMGSATEPASASEADLSAPPTLDDNQAAADKPAEEPLAGTEADRMTEATGENPQTIPETTASPSDYHPTAESPYSSEYNPETYSPASEPPSGGDGGEPPSGGAESGDSSGGEHEEEEEGGPVKSFLEHLEDLRWVIIKCASATFVGMLVCLLGANYVVKILLWPLERAGHTTTALFGPTKTKHVGVAAGDEILWQFKIETNQFAGLDLGKEQAVVLRMTTIQLSNQPVLALTVETNSPLAKKIHIGPQIVYLDPAAPFISSLYIALFGGLVLAAPFLFYFIGEYIVPALKWKERKYLGRAFLVGLGLFLTGVSFCYFWIMPLALRAAEQYSLWLGIQVPQWRAETYFSFTCKFMLGMGLGFEMPVVLLALVKIGILDYQKLAGFRRYMIVVNLILGALLTTPEVFTQVLMFIPLQLLYEITIWIAWYWERKERKKAAAEAAGNT